MDQTELLPPSDDPYEALRIVVMRLGGPKKVGQLLRPELTLEQGSIWINNCLNRDRPEKLDIDQIDLLIGLGRKKGCHAVMQCFGIRHFYSINPIEPEDERARLQRQVLEIGGELKDLLTRLDHVNQQAPLKAVK